MPCRYWHSHVRCGHQATRLLSQLVFCTGRSRADRIMAAGILMCVGRNISKMSDDEEKPRESHPIEEIDLDATRRKQWREKEKREF
ncbi:hypothetical protein DPMN_088899 [Dreissena polymorpha]|uniref:Uncharacterized protein n=1 Tax=Dreissena polymorpha TaxID=45954 RepID=A0A9D4KX50_DREPO|nr:hypothetical protein DPMN_088899 [Dreissena polymorpha]